MVSLMYIAKPNLNNTMHVKEFDTANEAVKYLNSFLPTGRDDEMPSFRDEDYFLIGKLYRKDGSTEWIDSKHKKGRPKNKKKGT